MKLKWQQLATITKSPRSLVLFGSKDPFFLKYGLDFLKKVGNLPSIETYFVDKHFNWQDWYNQQVLGCGLFDTEKTFVLHLQEKLPKEAQTLFAELASQDIMHQFILLMPQINEKEKWLTQWSNRYYALTFWPLQQQEFQQWLKHACDTYAIQLSHPLLHVISQGADRSPEIALQVLEKLRHMPTPYDQNTIQQLMSQTKTIQLFDLQEAIVRRDPKQAQFYFSELWHNQTPMALFNWLFKTEILRLIKLKLSPDPSSTINQLGIHFSQKQLYLKQVNDWQLKYLTNLLHDSERLDKCMHGHGVHQAKQIMLNLIYQLIFPNACQKA